MIRFVIVRHGETFFNKVKRVQGWCDSPLSESGIAHAKLLKEYLKDYNFVHAYSSSSERCVDTMMYALGSRKVETTTLKSLKEIHFGTLEGEYIKDVFPDGTAHLDGYLAFGGESKEEARVRFFDSLQKIADEIISGDVLIVSHGSILKEVFSYLDEDFKKKNIELKGSVNQMLPNCSVSILEYDGKYHLLSYGNLPYHVKELLCI